MLIAVQGHDHPLLLRDTLTAAQLTWVAGAAPAARFECTAKVRYRQPDQACEVTLREDLSVDVRFSQAQRAVTPGQYVVFYSGEECLGGGVIESTRNEGHVDSIRSDRTAITDL